MSKKLQDFLNKLLNLQLMCSLSKLELQRMVKNLQIMEKKPTTPIFLASEKFTLTTHFYINIKEQKNNS